ncbi:hypothetical protein [Streptomyces sp. PH10-H1]|uniref:hypothetical protein n=1 Tax=Streptomyces sp. PH10-H1 TaxID=3046212 RepID=UPI0024B96A75|nr:hypothetical protein [Streptomyces sp. PH10-H1]MDJ0347255.1 hypothetical protein [Streptomyces sp. PH10-H1]
MPTYEEVSENRQLPSRKPKSAVAGQTAEVAITTTIPAPLRRQLSVALAVHQVKLKDAVAQAVEDWLAKNPPEM